MSFSIGDNKLIEFNLGGELFSFTIDAIFGVIRIPSMFAKLPNHEPFYKGLINFREHVIPLIDLREKLKISYENTSGVAIVLRDGDRGEEGAVAVIIDSLSSIKDISHHDIKYVESYDEKAGYVPLGVYMNEDKIVSIIDHRSIFYKDLSPDPRGLYYNVSNNNADNRFRVVRENKGLSSLSMYGSISDSIDLTALDQVMMDQDVIDMSGINFVSWMGLSRLATYVSQRAIKVSFLNYSFYFYLMARLIPELKDMNYLMGSFPIYHKSLKKITLSSISIKEATKDERENILYPSYFINDDAAAAGISPFLLYPSFSLLSLELSFGGIYNAKNNLLYFLSELYSKISSASLAFSHLSHYGEDKIVDRVATSISQIKDSFKSVEVKMDFFIKDLRLSFAKLKDAGDQDISNLLDGYMHSLKGVNILKSSISDLLSSLYKDMASVREVLAFKNKFNVLTSPSNDELAKMRDAFAIMDIMSEDDWIATRPLILAELESLDILIGKAFTSIYSVDEAYGVVMRRAQDSVQDELKMDEIRDDMEGLDIEAKIKNMLKKI